MVDAVPSEAYPLSKDAGAKVSVQHGTAKSHKWWQLGGRDYSHVAVDAGYENYSETSSLSDSSSDGVVKNRNNVYEDKDAADIYAPIEGYEGAHRFDPSATWTAEEENAIRRKVCSAQAHQKTLLRLVA